MILRNSTIKLEVPEGCNDVVLVKNLYLSCDPYMRSRMGKLDYHYVPPFTPDEIWRERRRRGGRPHFEKYGDILEAFIIFDKLTGRSKGYGFVTFKEADAAKKACEDPTPIINSRRTNCNLPSSARAAPGNSSNSSEHSSAV